MPKSFKPIALSVAEVKQLLTYNPETGVFTWLVRPVVNRGDLNHNNRRAGTEAGIGTGKGYSQIRLRGQLILAHRLAYYIMTGQQPELVDHKDGDKQNNKWSNLRAGTYSLNPINKAMSVYNRSGHKGVHETKHGTWQARIQKARKQIHLGTFDTYAEAVVARKAGEAVHFGSWNRVV